MFISIGSYSFCDGSRAGGIAIGQLHIRLDRVLDTATPVNVALSSGTLVVGGLYRVADYHSGDDFTNVGGANIDGAIFAATSPTPVDWSHGSVLIAGVPPVIFDRQCRKCEITFRVKRTFANLGTCEKFILQLDGAIPASGPITFTTFGPSAYSRVMPNGVLLRHALDHQDGATCYHTFTVAGGKPIPV